MNDAQKLEALQQMTGLDVTELGAAKKQEAEDAGRESKEVKEEAVVAVEAQEPPALVLTPELMGQALAAVMQPVLDRLDALEKAQTEPEEKETADPFAAMMNIHSSSVIGQPDARVDGRTKEAKDAPKERLDGFTAPRAKVNSDSLPAQSINRLFSGTTAKELSQVRQ